jgi:glycosyltransferase involved in cell wall biosynthesis
MSKSRVPKVLYIGGKAKLESTKYLEYEDTSLDVIYLDNDDEIEKIIISFKPDSIITVGKHWSEFPTLSKLPLEIRKKWFNVEEDTKENGEIAYKVAMNQILEASNKYLISYFTSAYNTGSKLWRVYKSLTEQTHQDWEWVIVNDSSDDKTLSIAETIAKKDSRVKVYDFKEKTNGIIGEAKYRAAMLCKGYLLAELDHDDTLTNNCTQDLINASLAFPEAGFFYTDYVEVNEYNQSLTYPEGFACGYGKYYKQYHNGFEWDVNSTPNINPKTIRHIVGIPNHIRAWRRDVYFAVGGHNRSLSVADDYELVVRTFLHTKFCKIPKLGYIQHLRFDGDEQNTHDVARADIQRRVRTIANYYNEAINKRFTELGAKDWVYESGIYNLFEIPSKYNIEEQYVNYILN